MAVLFAHAAAAQEPLDNAAEHHAAAEEPSLDALRAAAEKFKDVEVALAAGYIRDPMDGCETADVMGLPAEAGAMGIHYLRPDLLKITAVQPRVDGEGVHTDFLEPAVLLYEPQADGSLELVGVENLVFAWAWYADGNTAPPRSMASRTTTWSTIPRPSSTRPTASRPTTTATSGLSGRTRTASLPSSTRP